MWMLITLANAAPQVQPGDLVFQESKSQQAYWLKAVTASRYTHVGLVIESDGALAVLEAVQPVQIVTYERWAARGVDGHVAVRRPSKPLAPGDLDELTREGSRHLGKDYDLAFSWDDERLYCTELVAKAYQEALGWQVGKRRSIRSWEVTDARILAQMEARGMNLDEDALAPVDLLDDAHFVDPSAPQVEAP